jgi:hypothetical protein
MAGVAIDRGGRLWRLAAGACAAAVVVLSYSVVPEHWPVGQCIIKQTTGVSCLTCGMTRSFHAAAHGAWQEGFHFHLFGPLLFVAVILAGCIALGEAMSGTTMLHRFPGRLAGRLAIGFAAAWVGYGIIRAAGELMR